MDSLTPVNSLYKTTPVTNEGTVSSTTGSDFDSVLGAAMNMVNETNELQNAANDEEVKFALGESDNTHDLMIAEQKANIALQYTVAIRDRFLTAYNTIMQMQI